MLSLSTLDTGWQGDLDLAQLAPRSSILHVICLE